MPELAALQAHLAGMGRILLGYSGGVDSSLLAVAATRALPAEAFLAVIGRSASYPEVQWRTATALARRFGVPLLEIETRELEDPRYRANPTDRCYYCKTELWLRLEDVRVARGFDTVIDGTNADDLGEHRPGARAGRERAVRSPLLELGWTKARVREAAHELGIPIWDAPAAPCLASRVAYGLAVTEERLAQVERGEAFLRSLGISGDLRVRHHGDRARIEVLPDRLALLRARWDEVGEAFHRIGFAAVELDPRGYRRGGLLPLAPSSAG